MTKSSNQNRSKLWLFILATVLLLLSGYLILKNNSFKEFEKKTTDNSVVRNKELTLNRNYQYKPEATTNTQNPVKSYQGSQPDGAINLDDNGDIILDVDLKRLFDYYLSAIGELPLDQMRKYLQQFAAENLNPIQLQQLLEYFDQYSQYLTQSDLFFKNINAELSLEEKMLLLSEFRNETLGSAMANGFFSEQKDYINYVLADKNSENIDQQQGWLEAENEATKFHDVVLENREFSYSDSLSASEVYDYRVEQYGQEAANRLTQLDQERADWQDVVDDYFQQRLTVLNQSGEQSLSQLNSNYSPEQLRRLEALWRIENQ